MRSYVWRTPRKTCILKIGVEYNSRASHARRLFPAFLDHTLSRPFVRIPLTSLGCAKNTTVLQSMAGFLMPVAEKHSLRCLHAGTLTIPNSAQMTLFGRV